MSNKKQRNTQVRGAQIRPVERFIKLTDGSVRRLTFDFAAQATTEEQLNVRVLKELGKLEKRLGRKPTNEEAEAHLTGNDLGMGRLRSIATMAFCFCATWREDNLPDEEFQEFFRLMPDANSDEFKAIEKAVMAVGNAQKPIRGVDSAGNSDEADQESPQIGTASPISE